MGENIKKRLEVVQVIVGKSFREVFAGEDCP
jgi:hypothetical protein